MKKIFMLMLLIFLNLSQLYSMRGSKSLSSISRPLNYKIIVGCLSVSNLSSLDESECADTEDEEEIYDLYGYLGFAIKQNSPVMVSKAIRLGVHVKGLHLDLFFKTLLDKHNLNGVKNIDNYDLAILDLLLINGVKIKSKHLNVAIYLKSYVLIKLLLKYGVKVEQKHILLAESLSLKLIVNILKMKNGQYFHLYDRSDKIYWP